MSNMEETIVFKDKLNRMYGMSTYDMSGSIKRPIYVDTDDAERAKWVFNWGKSILEASSIPKIAQVYFNKTKGTTTVKWVDNTITTVTCDKEDTFDLYTGISLCIAKRALGNKSNFNNIIKKAADSAIESSKRKMNKKHE